MRSPLLTNHFLNRVLPGTCRTPPHPRTRVQAQLCGTTPTHEGDFRFTDDKAAARWVCRDDPALPLVARVVGDLAHDQVGQLPGNTNDCNTNRPNDITA